MKDFTHKEKVPMRGFAVLKAKFFRGIRAKKLKNCKYRPSLKIIACQTPDCSLANRKVNDVKHA